MPLIGSLIGLPNLIIALVKHREYLVSRSWPITDGEVIQSKITSTNQGSCYPDVIYTYEVNGEKFRCNRIWLTSWSQPSIKFSQKFADRFPVGSHVKVYYNPQNPKKAILEIKFTIGIVGCYVAAIVGLIIAMNPIPLFK